MRCILDALAAKQSILRCQNSQRFHTFYRVSLSYSLTCFDMVQKATWREVARYDIVILTSVKIVESPDGRIRVLQVINL